MLAFRTTPIYPGGGNRYYRNVANSPTRKLLTGYTHWAGDAAWLDYLQTQDCKRCSLFILQAGSTHDADVPGRKLLLELGAESG